MKSQKTQVVAKAAGESFSITASVVSFIFDIVASFTKIPLFIKWIVSGVAGLISACVSGRNALQLEDQKERQMELELQKKYECKHLYGDLREEKHSTSMIFSTVDNKINGRYQVLEANDPDFPQEFEFKPYIGSTQVNDRFFNDSTLLLMKRKEKLSQDPAELEYESYSTGFRK